MPRHLAILLLVAGCSKPSPSSSAPTKSDTPADPIAECDAFIAKADIDKTKGGWKLKVPEPPEFAFDAKRTYYWVIETNLGTIKIKFMPEYAPMHVSSTIYLARLGFYDGLTFHRVAPGFVVQGGDPVGDGSGGPAYRYASEIDTHARHSKAGILSMAHTRFPRSDGSQFFITLKAVPDLDDKYTVFGEVVDGMDAVRAMEKLASARDGPPRERIEIAKTSIEVE